MHAHRLGWSAVCLLALAALRPSGAAAHCDGMDGPVVQAAVKALAAGDPSLALAWVQPQDEAAIRQAFDRTLAVRKLNDQARELADLYFFETLVRVHRAGEGAPYTGLKPAGRDLGPAIPLADQALANGKVEPLVKLLTDAAREGAVARFDRARAAREHAGHNVAAGREYVHAYVAFVHYIEGGYQALAHPAGGHAEEPAAPDAGHEGHGPGGGGH